MLCWEAVLLCWEAVLLCWEDVLLCREAVWLCPEAVVAWGCEGGSTLLSPPVCCAGVPSSRSTEWHRASKEWWLTAGGVSCFGNNKEGVVWEGGRWLVGT